MGKETADTGQEEGKVSQDDSEGRDKRVSPRNGLYISALGGREMGDFLLESGEIGHFFFNLWISSLGFCSLYTVARQDAIFMCFSSGNSRQPNLGLLK